MLDRVSLSKSLTIDAQNQGTWTHLTSLYFLGSRFQGILKDPIVNNLKNIKKQFDKISKRIIVESEIGVIQGILEMIKIILQFKNTEENNI